MTAMKTCRDCQSTELVPRGPKSFRNQCHSCWAAAQRAAWARNREARLLVSRAKYQKHAEKRRAEATARKQENLEYYTLAEWFRRKGIPISHIDKTDIEALVAMKKAVRTAKAQIPHNP